MEHVTLADVSAAVGRLIAEETNITAQNVARALGIDLEPALYLMIRTSLDEMKSMLTFIEVHAHFGAKMRKVQDCMAILSTVKFHRPDDQRAQDQLLSRLSAECASLNRLFDRSTSQQTFFVDLEA